jgi:hypothetical protein
MSDLLSAVLRRRARVSGPGLISRLATRADYRAFEAWHAATPALVQPNGSAADHLAELDRSGICIVPNFWSPETCARARAEVERLIVDYPAYVNGNAKSDVRIYGANNASPLIDGFAQDPQLLAIASAYNRERTRTAFTLAAYMPFSDANNGSGEGWHRDAFLRQVKAILYLSDVGLDNGPFQWISDSHRLPTILGDMKRARLRYDQYRLSEDAVANLLRSDPGRRKTFTAAVGTLILVDTSAVHRGMPIRAGARYALTNYYFQDSKIDQRLYEKFDVLPRATPAEVGESG